MDGKATAAAPPGDGILIVGGYGQVGRSIAERLAPLFPGRVTVAGRNRTKAAEVAATIGRGVGGHAVDVLATHDMEFLDGVALVIVCFNQGNTRFAEKCLSRGIHYVDISADYDFLSRIELLNDVAQRCGATALLSVGVAPGLTNLLAARARQRMRRVDRIDILLVLGLRDRHGRAAVEWMLDHTDVAYQVMENGRPKSVRSFDERLEFGLPGERTERPAYRFNFSDQHVVARTLGVPTVSTWVRFEGRASTWLFAMASRLGFGRLLRLRWWRRIAIWLFMNVHMGSDLCGIAVRATGRTSDDGEMLTLGLVGRNEALMTAIVAAETARQLLSGNLAAGVLHSEQAIALDPVVAALRKDVPDLVVAV